MGNTFDVKGIYSGWLASFPRSESPIMGHGKVNSPKPGADSLYGTECVCTMHAGGGWVGAQSYNRARGWS